MTLCKLLGHDWFVIHEPYAINGRWVCNSCGQRAGTEKQHTGVPPGWLFTWWCGRDASVIKIMTGQA